MNRYDPAKRPGAHLVAEEFAVDDPWDLTDNLPLHHPLDFVGRMVAATARDVDSLHRQLRGAAQSAIQALQLVSRGDHSTLRSPDGILGASANQIELLAARRSAAYDQLTQVISSYHHLLRESEASQPSQAPDLGMKPELHQGSNGRTATTRVTAALHRSQAAPLPGHTDAAAPPTARPGPTTKPSHSR